MDDGGVAFENSFGFDSQSAQAAFYGYSVVADSFSDTASYSIYDRQTGADIYAGKISSFDTNGFTITWTKTGSPTGTIAIAYLAFD